MKLIVLWADKKPLLKTGCLQKNQNTTTKDPKKFDQSGPILGGVLRSNLDSTVAELRVK